MAGRNLWTPEEDRLLLELWGKETPKEIGLRLNRSEPSVKQHHYYLCGKYKAHPEKYTVQEMIQARKVCMQRSKEKGREEKRRTDTIKVLTIEEQQWLAFNYPYISDNLCALRLGLPESDIKVLAKAMKLKKEPYYYN